MVTNFLKNTSERIKDNNKRIALLDKDFMASLDGVPNPLTWVIALFSKERKQISKLEKENKKLEKQIKKHIKKGYHKAEPGIITYKEWCHYMYYRQWLTAEDLEFEETLRNNYKNGGKVI